MSLKVVITEVLSLIRQSHICKYCILRIFKFPNERAFVITFPPQWLQSCIEMGLRDVRKVNHKGMIGSCKLAKIVKSKS